MQSSWTTTCFFLFYTEYVARYFAVLLDSDSISTVLADSISTNCLKAMAFIYICMSMIILEEIANILCHILKKSHVLLLPSYFHNIVIFLFLPYKPKLWGVLTTAKCIFSNLPHSLTVSPEHS